MGVWRCISEGRGGGGEGEGNTRICWQLISYLIRVDNLL